MTCAEKFDKQSIIRLYEIFSQKQCSNTSDIFEMIAAL